jgi:hypothetical protein
METKVVYRQHSHSRVQKVTPMITCPTDRWPNIYGSVVPVILECGYVVAGNPATSWKVGELVRCGH